MAKTQGSMPKLHRKFLITHDINRVLVIIASRCDYLVGWRRQPGITSVPRIYQRFTPPEILRYSSNGPGPDLGIFILQLKFLPNFPDGGFM